MYSKSAQQTGVKRDQSRKERKAKQRPRRHAWMTADDYYGRWSRIIRATIRIRIIERWWKV